MVFIWNCKTLLVRDEYYICEMYYLTPSVVDSQDVEALREMFNELDGIGYVCSS